MSARNNVNDNSQDILAEYLARDEIKTQIADVFFGASPDDIEIGLPQKQQGAKRYSRVPMWYWLTDSSPYHLQSFNSVGVNGEAFSYQATAIGGCAPAFRIGKQRQ
jgi:hypothetical protein